MHEKYRLYVEEEDKYRKLCEKNFYIDMIPKVESIKNAVILPYRKQLPGNLAWSGGVCDGNGIFIEGHKQHLDSQWNHPGNIGFAYPFSNNIKQVHETVVWGGFIRNEYGHFITESLSRMWYLLENKEKKYKFAFIAIDNNINIEFIDFYHMLGLQKDDILIITEPTRFDCVIIPEQTISLNGNYMKKSMIVYDAIRDSVKPKNYEKIYLTHRKLLDTTGTDSNNINEEFFEHYFSERGYKIISPESLSLSEKVSILANVKEIACIGISSWYQILFCQNGIKLMALNRSREPIEALFKFVQARSIDCTIIDISFNFLPHNHYGSSYLLMPTLNWKKYIFDLYGECNSTEIFPIEEYFKEYLKKWATSLVNARPHVLHVYRNYTLADLIIGIYRYLIDEILDDATIKKLHEVFLSPVLLEQKNKIIFKEISDLKEEIAQKEKDLIELKAECERKKILIDSISKLAREYE